MLLPFTDYSTQDTDGNFFIGVISGTPIARILLHEQPDDNDGIGLDNLYFGDSNSQPCFKPLGDLNLDCRVDFFDLSLLAARWLLDCKSSPGDPLCNPN